MILIPNVFYVDLIRRIKKKSCSHLNTYVEVQYFFQIQLRST